MVNNSRLGVTSFPHTVLYYQHPIRKNMCLYFFDLSRWERFSCKAASPVVKPVGPGGAKVFCSLPHGNKGCPPYLDFWRKPSNLPSWTPWGRKVSAASPFPILVRLFPRPVQCLLLQQFPALYFPRIHEIGKGYLEMDHF